MSSAFDSKDRSRRCTGPRVLPRARRAVRGPGLAWPRADVVELEFPEGDPFSHIGPFVGDHRSLCFSATTTGKLGLPVGPRSPAGRRDVDDLLAWAHVVGYSFRSMSRHELRVDLTALLASRPGLIVVTVSGFAAGTKLADRPASHLTIQAEAGLTAVTGEPVGAPIRSGGPVSELFAGLWAALAVASRLITGKCTGLGLQFDPPLMKATWPLLAYLANRGMATGQEPGSVKSGHPRLVPYRVYPTRDRYPVIAVLSGKSWLASCVIRALNALAAREDLANMEAGNGHRKLVDRAVEDACAKWTFPRLLRALEPADVPASLVRTTPDALANVYAHDRENAQRALTFTGECHIVRGPLDATRRAHRSASVLYEPIRAVLDEARTRPGTAPTCQATLQ